MTNRQYDHLISKLNVLDMKLERLFRMEKKELATFADIQADEIAEKKALDAVVAFINDLKSHPTLPDGSVAVPQADIDALHEALGTDLAETQTAATP